MYNWIASWFSSEKEDETIYQVEDQTSNETVDPQVIDDWTMIGEVSKEWTWIESITDTTSDTNRNVLIQTTRTIDDLAEDALRIAKLRKRYIRRYFKKYLPSRVYSNENERRTMQSYSTKGTSTGCSERQLVRYCQKKSSSTEAFDANALLRCKPFIQFFMDLDTTKCRYDISKLLAYLVSEYGEPSHVNGQERKKDMLMIEWRKDDHIDSSSSTTNDEEHQSPINLVEDQHLEHVEDRSKNEPFFVLEYDEISHLTDLFGDMCITPPTYHELPEWMRRIDLFSEEHVGDVLYKVNLGSNELVPIETRYIFPEWLSGIDITIFDEVVAVDTKYTFPEWLSRIDVSIFDRDTTYGRTDYPYSFNDVQELEPVDTKYTFPEWLSRIDVSIFDRDTTYGRTDYPYSFNDGQELAPVDTKYTFPEWFTNIDVSIFERDTTDNLYSFFDFSDYEAPSPQADLIVDYTDHHKVGLISHCDRFTDLSWTSLVSTSDRVLDTQVFNGDENTNKSNFDAEIAVTPWYVQFASLLEAPWDGDDDGEPWDVSQEQGQKENWDYDGLCGFMEDGPECVTIQDDDDAIIMTELLKELDELLKSCRRLNIKKLPARLTPTERKACRKQRHNVKKSPNCRVQKQTAPQTVFQNKKKAQLGKTVQLRPTKAIKYRFNNSMNSARDHNGSN